MITACCFPGFLSFVSDDDGEGTHYDRSWYLSHETVGKPHWTRWKQHVHTYTGRKEGADSFIQRYKNIYALLRPEFISPTLGFFFSHSAFLRAWTEI